MAVELTYKNIIDPDSIRYLEGKSRVKRLNGACPRCDFNVDDQRISDNDCEKDADGIHIQYKRFMMYELANIPYKYTWLDFDSEFLNESIKGLINEYVDSLDSAVKNGFGMYIYSPGLGTGKTFCASHILMSACKKGMDCFYTSFSDLVSIREFDEFEQSFIKGLVSSTPLLVIDDVTPGISNKQAQYFGSSLEHTLRHRVHNGLATIITTNMTPDDLKGSYNRVFSLMNEGALEVELESTSDARIEHGIGRVYNRILSGERPLLR